MAINAFAIMQSDSLTLFTTVLNKSYFNMQLSKKSTQRKVRETVVNNSMFVTFNFKKYCFRATTY